MDPEMVRKELMIDESEVHRRLIAKAKPHVGFDGQGRPQIPHREQYNTKQQIALLLVGRWFAHQAQVAASATMAVAEVAALLGLDEKIAGARLSDLRHEGFADSVGRGLYAINYARAETLLDGLGRA